MNLKKIDNLRVNYHVINKDNNMIGVDIDQIHGFTSLFISNVNMRNEIHALFKSTLLFPTSTPFIPKEIYNIISIKYISLISATKKLIIDNIIINLRNIKIICAQDTPNVIISRNILRLALLNVFYYGSKATGYREVCRNNKEQYIKIITENTTILD